MGLSEFKYIIFFAVLFIGVPIGVILAVSNRFFEKVVLFLMLFFTCRLEETINFVSRETYRGTSRGFEVCLVDMATLVMFFVVLFKRDFKVKIFPPGTVLYGIYFFFSLVSIMNADETLYSYFEIWKMIRMYFYYWVFFNYFADEERIKLLIKFIPAIVIYIFGVAVMQKYVYRYYQIHGPLPHQNSLAMYMTVVNCIIFGQLLNEKVTAVKNMFLIGIFGMGSLLILFTLSRAGMACYALSCSVVLFFSYVVGMNAKKVIITALLACLGAAVLVVAIDSIIRRIDTAPKASRITRYNLAVSASNMANDKIFGVGLNNFGLKVNKPYPYSKHFEKGHYPKGFKEGLVETVYLMVAAETGWFNLFIFIIYIMYFYMINLMNIFRFQRRNIQFVAVGLAGGLLGIYLQSSLEWVLKQSCNFYQLMMVFALIGAMARINRDEKRGLIKRSADAAPVQ